MLTAVLAEPDYRKTVLNNGLRVVSVNMPHLRSAELVVYLGVGGRYETAARSGVSHFLEHMLFRGTSSHPTSLDLERAFEVIGGAANASTDTEITCYHTRLHPSTLGQGVALFASMLREPLLADLETERAIILEEALEDFNQRGEDINPDNLTSRLLWPDHPLGQSTIGSRESLLALQRGWLEEHLATYYTPHNAVITVAGRVNHEALVDDVSRYFGDWQGNAAPACLPVDTAGPAAQIETSWVRDSTSQVSLQLAFRVPGRQSPLSMPLRVLRRILAGGGCSRLMLRLREQLGLVYNVDASVSLFADCGCLSIDSSVAPDKLVQTVSETFDQVRILREELVSREELDLVVRGYLYDLEFSQDHPDEMTVRYGWGNLADCLRSVHEDRQALLAVTPEVIRETARQTFLPGHLKMAVVGPWRVREQRAVEKILPQF